MRYVNTLVDYYFFKISDKVSGLRALCEKQLQLKG